MAVERANALASPHTAAFLQGAVALSQIETPYTPQDLNGFLPAAATARAEIVGTAAAMSRQVSWWDLMAWWHVVAMSMPTAGGGNRAHRGPVFLPWHRPYLRRLEEIMQLIWGDDTFGLPYWDWGQDGELATGDQPGGQLWNNNLLGNSQGVVDSGTLGNLRIRLWENAALGRLQAVNPRPIFREAGLRGFPDLANKNAEATTLADPTYDRPTWGGATTSFRSKLEGFVPSEQQPSGSPWMHNRVHLWVGGDMTPGTSPNDPVFWLNHCNVDRLWEQWMQVNGRQYQPGPGQGPAFHRSDSPLYSIFTGGSMTPQEVLDPTQNGLDWYVYI